MERDIIFIISKPKRIVILVLSYILICSGCYTETREVEKKYKRQIFRNASLPDSLKTTIIFKPSILYYENVKRDDTVAGQFKIVNTGTRRFKINYVYCYAGCDVKANKHILEPKDSAVVEFKMGIGKNWVNAISPVSVIGNVQTGVANFVIHANLKP